MTAAGPQQMPWHGGGGRLPLTITVAYALVALPAVVLLPPLASADVAAGVVLAAVLIALSTVDLRRFRLPDFLTISLLILGLALSYLRGWEPLEQRALAALAGFALLYAIAALYRRVRRRDGLGLGDAKLLAASGAWVGLTGLLSVVLIACVSAGIAVVGLMLRGDRLDRQSAIPFGPFLALGTWVVWLYGPLA